MSAWMVSKGHIDALIRISLEGPKDGNRRQWSRPYFQHQELTYTQADLLGETLTKENLASINYRYPDTVHNPDNTPGPVEHYWLEPYEYRSSQAKHITAVEALKAIACYEYQACEHPQWEQSEARAFCQLLREHIICALPGFDAAPWGIESAA